MLNIETIRTHFPALSSGATFFDNPGGTQVAREVIERMQNYYLHMNANDGGAFYTSQQTDAIVFETRRAVADFLHATRPEEIIFGQNMTSLTFHISRSIARLLEPGDELVVTRLDHDANVAPWLLIAEDRGCRVRWVDFHTEDCTLDMEDLERQITPRTRIVAVGYASNAVGTINPVAEIAKLAHSVGALIFVDAVHYAPHGAIDVQALDCDFLACSPYKFFGPHMGTLYGKHELLMRFAPYKVRPAPDALPDRWETGTQVQELIAGIAAAVEYLAALGKRHDPAVHQARAPPGYRCGSASAAVPGFRRRQARPGGGVRRSRPPAFNANPLSTRARYNRALLPELNMASSISRAG